MDTSTFCDSTSTSAPLKLGLRLLTCTPPVYAFRFDMTVDCVAFELLSCRFGRFRLHTSLRLRALIRSCRGVYVCKFRGMRTRFQFNKTLPVEHSSEHFCCVGTHFQAFMNLLDVFFLRCFSEARKKHFRRNFRKCSRMRPIGPLPVDLGANLPFRQVFSSGSCSELQKNFRTRNSSRKRPDFS